MGLSQQGKVIHQPLITRTGPDIKPGSCTVTARNLRRQALWALTPSQCAFCLDSLGLPKVSPSTLIVSLYNRTPFSLKNVADLSLQCRDQKTEGPVLFVIILNASSFPVQQEKKHGVILSRHYSC